MFRVEDVGGFKLLRLGVLGLRVSGCFSLRCRVQGCNHRVYDKRIVPTFPSGRWSDSAKPSRAKTLRSILSWAPSSDASLPIGSKVVPFWDYLIGF